MNPIIREQDFVLRLDTNSLRQVTFIWIPQGEFVMGNPYYDSQKGSSDPYDQPPVQVELTKGYWLSKHKINVATWSFFFSRLPHKSQNLPPHSPLSGANWHEAIAFCEFLNSVHEGSLPPNYWFSLPTEAQWEYGCKCNTLKKAGLTQLSDMMGTGLEWCYDGFGPYPATKSTDTIYDLGHYDSLRIVRGSTSTDLESYTCSSRLELPTRAHLIQVGFRVALRHIKQ